MKISFFLLLALICSPSFAQETSTPLNKNLARTVLTQERVIRQLQQEIQQLRGDNETFHYQLKKLREQQRNFNADTDERLRQIETGNFGTINLAGQAPDKKAPADDSSKDKVNNNSVSPKADDRLAAIKPPAFTGKDPQTPPAKGSKQEKSDYQTAFMTLQRGKQQRAIQKFQEFIKAYPYGEYADNAQYWLGEAYYSLSDFRSALTEFNGLLEYHPDSKKKAHAMLKVGFCYYELRDRKRAKEILKTVMQRFPTTATARLAEKRLERLRSEGW